MSTPEEPDWVRQGTPRDVDAEWNDEQSEYGTTVSPVEWDDYSSEQSVPVERPRPVAQPPVTDQGAAAGAETAEDDFAAQPQATPPSEDGLPETPQEPIDTSDDAAVMGAPIEDQPVLPEDDADAGLEPAVTDEPDVEPVDAPVAGTTDTGRPVAAEEPTAEEFGASEPRERLAPGTDIPAPVPAGSSDLEDSEEESFEEESLDEPSIDDYDEPHDDETVAAVPGDDVRDEEYDPDATGVSPAVGSDADATDDALARDDRMADDDATRVVPVAVGAAGATAVAGASPLPDDLYRTGETAVIDDREALAARAREADEAEARERELQAQLDAERRARDERLGVVATSSENEVRDPATAYKVSTDRFFGSLGLFVLRLVTATILGVTGYQVLTNVDRTTEFLSQTAIPEPRLVTWIVGFTLGTLALLLVIGLVQRAVGVVLLLLSIGSLVFIRWGAFSPFVEGREGFLGDKTLLLAAVGFVLIGVGGGLWGVDGAFRRARAAARADKG